MENMYVKRVFAIMLTLALFIGNLQISYAEENVKAEPVEESKSEAESPKEDAEEFNSEVESADETTDSEQTSGVKTITIPVQRTKQQVVSVILPTVAEPSPFNFLMDPQELIYLTSAEKYGGGIVEEGATLLFRNSSGDYDFSSYSDKLTIKNESNVAVNITVNASISDTSGINMVSSPEFGDSTGCDMYMALVDNKGQEIPLSDDGRIVANARLDASPEANYTYYLDQESGNYACVFNPVGGFDEYSFGLRGRCNPNGDWKDINVTPDIVLTWSFEAEDAETITEEMEIEVPEEKKEQEEVKEEKEEVKEEKQEEKKEPETKENTKEEEKAEQEKSVEENQNSTESTESSETQNQQVENTSTEAGQQENTGENTLQNPTEQESTDTSTTVPSAEPSIEAPAEAPVQQSQPESTGESAESQPEEGENIS